MFGSFEIQRTANCDDTMTFVAFHRFSMCTSEFCQSCLMKSFFFFVGSLLIIPKSIIFILLDWSVCIKAASVATHLQAISTMGTFRGLRTAHIHTFTSLQITQSESETNRNEYTFLFLFHAQHTRIHRFIRYFLSQSYYKSEIYVLLWCWHLLIVANIISNSDECFGASTSSLHLINVTTAFDQVFFFSFLLF